MVCIFEWIMIINDWMDDLNNINANLFRRDF
jgi:hypothetical protein